MADTIRILIENATGKPSDGVIQDGASQGMNLQNADGTVNAQVTSNKTASVKPKQAATIAAGVYAGKQAFSFATSKVGQFTGDERKQEQVNNIIKATAILAGIARGGPTAVITVIGAGIEFGANVIDYNYNQKWLRREAAVNAQRVGLETFGKSGRSVTYRR